MDERFGFGVFLTAAGILPALLLAAVILLFLLAFGLWLRGGGPFRALLRFGPQISPVTTLILVQSPLFYRENAVWHAVQQVAVMGLSADRFSGCASVAAGVGADGRHYLVLDGWTGISGNNLASVLLYFDEDTQQMVPADQISTEKLYTASLRNVPSLVSQDLDGDGIVEIPTQPDEAGLLNMSQSRRMDFIVWMDYTSPNPEKSFGLLDEETNCYIELPMEWEGNLKLTDSEQYDGAVELRTVDEDELVMTLRLVRTTSSLKGWTRLGIVASRQMQAKLAPDVEIRDKNYRLSKALYLLN